MAIYKAQWDFAANDPDQLSFKEGDRIKLLKKDPSGWYLGEIRLPSGNVKHGVFPANYCNPVGSLLRQDSTFSVGSYDQSTQGLLIVDSKVSDGEKQHVLNIKKRNQKDASRTVFRVYAHKQMLYGGFVALVIFGLLAVHFGAEEKVDGSGIMDVGLGMLATLVGVILGVYEYLFEGEPIIEMFPLRALLWLVMSGICFVSFPLWTAGLFLLIAAFIDVIGFLKDEPFIPSKKKRKTRRDKELAEENANLTCCDKVTSYIVHKHEENKLQRMIFCALYASGNVALAIYTAVIWTDIVNSQDEDDRLSPWAPWAKAFGAIIDVNSSLLLIPVCRTIIRFIYNRATSQETCSAKAIRIFFDFVPLDKALLLHKTLAKISLFGVIFHTVAHFINYNIRPDQTVALFGLWPFYSGVILLVMCQLIYMGAFEDVKRPTFEIFWYSHHLFIFYFAITLTHGAGGFNPNFWFYFIIPGILYIIERICRYIRSKRDVSIVSVMVMEPNLLAIEMEKSAFGTDGYREGQYVFVNCPSVKPFEWHPFTISSPPQKDTWTLHIQVQGPGSWTEGVRDYLMSLAPSGKFYHELMHRNNLGKVVKGRVLGPNGLKMLLIDGPHSAPTQHMTEYEVAMIAGAGIGLTPVIACAESIVYHRWKFGLGKIFPAHCHFFWVVSYRDVEAYRWFAAKVCDCQNALTDMRKKGDGMKGKSWKFNIYITSVPKVIKTDDVKNALSGIKRKDFWGRRSVADMKVIQEKATFGREQLYKYMLNPKEKKKQFGDITVIKGRPDWSPLFERVAHLHPNKNVGVMFCGNRYIGKDLKQMCGRYSSVEHKQFFKLHKENF
mmetsp:Transcript_21801/g.35113  ORF Transcript_21801/g.35113 Transcript_21801/m.35113 type:complete len:834 (+) Transcript_21801:61-2562(+)